MRRTPSLFVCFFRQEGKNVEGRKGEVQATSTLRAWDPPPALLVVRAVVTTGNTSGLLLWPPIAALNLYRKERFLRRMVESPPVHLGREASVSGSSAPVSGMLVGDG